MYQPRPLSLLRAGQSASNSFILIARQSSRTSNFNVFCFARPGIEPPTSRMPGETLNHYTTRPWYSQKEEKENAEINVVPEPYRQGVIINILTAVTSEGWRSRNTSVLAFDLRHQFERCDWLRIRQPDLDARTSAKSSPGPWPLMEAGVSNKPRVWVTTTLSLEQTITFRELQQVTSETSDLENRQAAVSVITRCGTFRTIAVVRTEICRSVAYRHVI